MKHLFLNKELSELAKEKGFNEPCFGYYLHEEFNIGLLHNTETEKNSKDCAAPLYQQIVDWFIEKYFIDITIHYQCSVNEVLDVYGRINFMINEFSNPDVIVRVDDIDWPTREDVLNRTLEEAFKLIP